jgi:hypothetical protein
MVSLDWETGVRHPGRTIQGGGVISGTSSYSYNRLVILSVFSNPAPIRSFLGGDSDRCGEFYEKSALAQGTTSNMSNFEESSVIVPAVKTKAWSKLSSYKGDRGESPM